MSARYDFLSDNTAGGCPEALSALIAHNAGFEPGYGSDAVTRRAADALRALLDADADVHFVASGTAANAIACSALCRPFESVLAHDRAHILTHETGAANFFGHGLDVHGLPGECGRMDPDALLRTLAVPDAANRRSPAALSITNATECGTVYRPQELARLCEIARAHALKVHLDGARLANAIAAGFDVKTVARLGVGILVIGGSKSGASLSEALILLDKTLSPRFDARLKQLGQLCSKSRFLAAPWLGLLDPRGSEESPWIRHARHANAMAQKLAAAIPYTTRYPVEANCVFVEMDEATFHRLEAAGWRVARFHSGTVRFVCSWAVTEEAVDELAHTLRSL